MTSAPTSADSTAPSGKKKHSIRPSHIVQGGHTPVVMQEAERRAASVQLRIADAITSFAGSMAFVYVHIVLFAIWMIWLEKFPWPSLTLVVSLEAIFLSTFVMIGQNRQASFAQAKADHDFVSQEKELADNTQLTKEIHQLTKELHARLLEAEDAIKSGRVVRAQPAATTPAKRTPRAKS
jgi:uncharacterized membrane protein